MKDLDKPHYRWHKAWEAIKRQYPSLQGVLIQNMNGLVQCKVGYKDYDYCANYFSDWNHGKDGDNIIFRDSKKKYGLKFKILNVH